MRFNAFIVILVLVSFTNVGRSEERATIDARAESIDGVWLPSSAELAGKPWPEEFRKITRLTINGDQYTLTVGQSPDKGTLKLDPSTTPKSLDIIGTEGPNKGKTILAIYQLQGDELKICYDLSGKSRPADFKTAAKTKLFLVTYQRGKS